MSGFEDDETEECRSCIWVALFLSLLLSVGGLWILVEKINSSGETEKEKACQQVEQKEFWAPGGEVVRVTTEICKREILL